MKHLWLVYLRYIKVISYIQKNNWINQIIHKQLLGVREKKWTNPNQIEPTQPKLNQNILSNHFIIIIILFFAICDWLLRLAIYKQITFKSQRAPEQTGPYNIYMSTISRRHHNILIRCYTSQPTSICNRNLHILTWIMRKMDKNNVT